MRLDNSVNNDKLRIWLNLDDSEISKLSNTKFKALVETKVEV